MELYVVGGCVRDALFEHFHGFTFNPKDYDLATPEHPDTVLEVLRSPKCRHNGIKALEVGKAFGVVVAVFPSGNEYEIATFREEWYDPDAGDGRRPDEVKFSTPEADAQRRDLTINSLFYNIVDSEIVDHVGTGISDIENVIIRPPGDPSQRYREDRLRVLRTARFFSRYRSDPATEHLTDETLQAISEWKHLPGVSLERVVAEFCSGIKQAIQPDHFLASLQNLDLYDAIFPDRRVNSLGFAAKTRSPAVVLACLLHEHRKGLNKYLNGRTRHV
jgi:tRNA nucleotidyltransferase/poly(A) polymerase